MINDRETTNEVLSTNDIQSEMVRRELNGFGQIFITVPLNRNIVRWGACLEYGFHDPYYRTKQGHNLTIMVLAMLKLGPMKRFNTQCKPL